MYNYAPVWPGGYRYGTQWFLFVDKRLLFSCRASKNSNLTSRTSASSCRFYYARLPRSPGAYSFSNLQLCTAYTLGCRGRLWISLKTSRLISVSAGQGRDKEGKGHKKIIFRNVFLVWSSYCRTAMHTKNEHKGGWFSRPQQYRCGRQ